MIRIILSAGFGLLILGFCSEIGYSQDLTDPSTNSTDESSNSTDVSSTSENSTTNSTNSPDLPSATENSTITSTDSSTTNPTTVSPVSSTTISPCQGMYGTTANTTDPTCQAYMICIPLEFGYKIYRMKCPNKLVFRPSTRTCVTTAMYPCTQTG